MWQRKRNRLPLEVYQGQRIYHITICTFQSKRLFIDDEIVNTHLAALKSCAEKYHFEVLAYCYMPDHVHLLLASRDNNESDEDGNLKASATYHNVAETFRSPLIIKVIRAYKQLTGFAYKRVFGQPLWQKSYYDHILRKEEDIIRNIRYLLENPVRKDLVKEFYKYPYSGSLKWGREIFNMVE